METNLSNLFTIIALKIVQRLVRLIAEFCARRTIPDFSATSFAVNVNKLNKHRKYFVNMLS